MRVADGEAAFRRFLQSRNLEVRSISVADAINVWIDFYKAQRFDDVEEGMDWLWFQYGTYDWGNGVSYQLDLTRQFILSGETDDAAIWQMHLVLHFPPGPEHTSGLPSLDSGMEECDDPADAEAFRERIVASDPVTRVEGMEPARVELYLGNAG